MRRWVWGGTALWLAVVVVGSGLAWIAIDRAGQQLSPAGPSLVDRTSTTPSPSATPPGIPRPPTAKPTSGPTLTNQPRVGSWTGDPGTVTVSCTGTRGTLIGATPADGWRVERRESGDRPKVRFERGEDEIEVEARCTSAGPVFETSSERDE